MNAELIDGLRWCADESICCDDFSGEKCPYYDEKKDSCSVDEILHAAADALEEDDKRINVLEDDLRDSTISNPERFRICGYSLRDLILFADMCKRNNVQESDLKQAAWNLELAVHAVMNERQEIVKNTMDEITMRFMPDFEKAFAEMRGEHAAERKDDE